MKQRVFLSVVALFMLFAGSLQTMADSNKDYYSKVVVEVASGAGKVYAAYNGGDYKEGGAESGKDTQSEAPKHTYKIKAVADNGYSFSQWNDGNTNAERTDIRVTAAEKVEDATKTYTATFTAINYTITLVPGSGSVVWTEKAYTIESEDVDLPTPNDPSYQFDGWYDNDAFTGDRVTKVAKGSFGNKTFYAHYQKVEETINISDAGFATYAPPFNATITRNDGAEVWYVSDWTATTLKFTKYEGETLLKGEGVLLKQGGTSVTFTKTDAACEALDGNKLKGNIEPTVFEANEIFILSNGTNGVGFYPNTAGTLKAGKAYLNRSEWETATGSAIGEFQMLFGDEETGIGNVNDNVNDNERLGIFNLAGQRIAGLQKGINIVNGKKILVK